jgi:hypothetical protein
MTTHEELRQAAIECLAKVFKGDPTIQPHIIQAATSIVLSPVAQQPVSV